VVKPLTVIGELAAVPVILPGLDVAVKPVIVEPPSSTGAVNVTVAELDDATAAVPIVGAPGTVLAIGQTPPATACICCVWFHTLDATPDLPPVVVGGTLLIKPPRYLVDIS
jgi:hypothetical protein